MPLSDIYPDGTTSRAQRRQVDTLQQGDKRRKNRLLEVGAPQAELDRLAHEAGREPGPANFSIKQGRTLGETQPAAGRPSAATLAEPNFYDRGPVLPGQANAPETQAFPGGGLRSVGAFMAAAAPGASSAPVEPDRKVIPSARDALSDFLAPADRAITEGVPAAVDRFNSIVTPLREGALSLVGAGDRSLPRGIGQSARAVWDGPGERVRAAGATAFEGLKAAGSEIVQGASEAQPLPGAPPPPAPQADAAPAAGTLPSYNVESGAPIERDREYALNGNAGNTFTVHSGSGNDARARAGVLARTPTTEESLREKLAIADSRMRGDGTDGSGGGRDGTLGELTRLSGTQRKVIENLETMDRDFSRRLDKVLNARVGRGGMTANQQRNAIDLLTEEYENRVGTQVALIQSEDARRTTAASEHGANSRSGARLAFDIAKENRAAEQDTFDNQIEVARLDRDLTNDDRAEYARQDTRLDNMLKDAGLQRGDYKAFQSKHVGDLNNHLADFYAANPTALKDGEKIPEFSKDPGDWTDAQRAFMVTVAQEMIGRDGFFSTQPASFDRAFKAAMRNTNVDRVRN